MRTLQIKHARRRFSAERDADGVPHIRADSWRAALYGLGYLHALDRPTQMLFSRALAGGRATELLANTAELLETDRFFRRVGLHLELENEVRALDDNTFAQLTAYCEGVTDGLEQAGRSFPMWAAGFRITPWDQKSVLLIGNLLSFGGLAVGQQQNERLILELIQAGVDDEMLRELFAPCLDQVDFQLIREINMASRLSDATLELITDLPRLAGSNAWAISPRRSVTGRALLAADPHLEVNRLPAIWYEAVLNWGEHYVMGATLPGSPLFAVGRTERLAWGVTYMKGDTSDYFIEDCRPGGVTGWQYRRGQQWHDFQLRCETLDRKGAPSFVERVYFNDVGTLESDPDQFVPDPSITRHPHGQPPVAIAPAHAAAAHANNGHSEAATKPSDILPIGGSRRETELPHGQSGKYLSVAWIGTRSGTGQAMKTWLDLIAAPAAKEAMDVVRGCPQPTLTFVFADVDGHIGQQGCGWFPKRPDPRAGLMPLPAWDSANHWQGLLDKRHLPRVYDPACGFVSAANEDVSPPGGPALVTMVVPEYRKQRLEQQLRLLTAANLADMQRLQYDVVSLQAQQLRAVFMPYLPEGNLRRRLEAWDCSYSPESTEATLFSRLYRNVLLEIFGQVPGERGIGWRRMLYLSTRCGFSTMMLTNIDRLLHREHSLWWHGRDKGELIRRAAEKMASEPDAPWSQTNAFHFANRFLDNHRLSRALGFDTGDKGMPGCHATIFQGHVLSTATRQTTFAPSYHFVTDMGTSEAWTNLPGGPSESRFSSYYRNDIPRWISGEYKRLGR